MLKGYIKIDIALFRIIFLFFGLSVYCVNSFAAGINGEGAKAYYKTIPPTISLTGLNFESRIAQLSWSTTDPLLQGTYSVERQVASSGTWNVIGQLPYTAMLEYSDTISHPYCSATDFSYRISFAALVAGNDAASNTVDLVLWDQTSPANVTDVIVSITPNRFPVINWTKVTGDAIFGYEIDRFNGFSWPAITTLPADSNSYIDNTVMDGCDNIYSYVIVTVDRCGLRSAPSYSPEKQTIKLTFPPIGECERLAKLSWNPYHVMPGGLGGYKIFRLVDYGTPVEVANITDTLINNYTDAFQFESGRNYTYYVQAYSATGSGVSISCKQTWKFLGASVPDSVYIAQVSVQSDSYIRINYHSSPDSTVKKMILERSADGGATFQAIDSLSVAGDFVPQDYYFDDTEADIHSQSYSYRLLAIDYCGTNTLYSNISKSIYLNCSASENQNTIDWNGYESWLQGIEGYKVYRTESGVPAAGELIGSVTPATNTFPDFLATVDRTKEICYWVVGAENPGNPYLVNAISVSNVCCNVKEATLFMPNAFRPGGKNNRFRPVATSVDTQSFSMTIFSRWGQVLFETDDMVSGWNGLINGQIAPAGLYAYILSYTSLSGRDFTKRGTVLVVR